jgi:prepilin-type N-terminal cleavage/methylation domain-containing protein
MRMQARGFTVLELVVALALIGVLAAAAGWRALAWLPELRLEAAARQVVLDLRWTRARAMAEQTYRRLVFAPAGETYRRQRRSGTTYQNDGPPIGLPAGIDLFDCSAANAAISFAPRGTAASFGRVTLRNANGRERQVIVDIVGRVRVQ